MFQAKVEREEYETEVKFQNDPENPMSFSSLKNRAKLSTPPIFNGTYSEEYNILNWIIAVDSTFYNAKFPLVPTRALRICTLVLPAKHGSIPNLLVIQRQHGLLLLQP